jgi:DNA adenine methylase
MVVTIDARPFLKFAGGKRVLLPTLTPLLPPVDSWEGYCEPFVGGGAMFFMHCAHVRPAVLADANERLVITYKAIRDQVDDVIDELRTLPYREEVYYAVRDRFNRERKTAPRHEMAAWMIYLNRTCVNGLYRENRVGEFNVGFGTYDNPRICDAENLAACSRALAGVDIRHSDFAETIRAVRRGWVVFADPPYVPIPGKNSFTDYIARPFTSGASTAEMLLMIQEGRTDHQRLADSLRLVDQIGAYFMTTNSDTAEAKRVFAGWDTKIVQAPRSINSDAEGRGKVNEIVVCNSHRWRSGHL